MTGSRLLNVGCGLTFHDAWENLDGLSVSSRVRQCDIRKGLPYPAEWFDACYCSHVLEHLSPTDAQALLAEMRRVLKPGGVVRIVVPDLERVARDYLGALARARAGEPRADDDYDWMMIQLLDQSVRRRSGGAMSDFWRDPSRQNMAFVAARGGVEAERIMRDARLPRGWEAGAPRPLRERLRGWPLSRLITEARRRIAALAVHVIAGARDAENYREGVFRDSGEIHHWMYDAYSLERSLRSAGFAAPRICAADESAIPGFARFELDVVGGRVRKPDSLFMEALRDVRNGEMLAARGGAAGGALQRSIADASTVDSVVTGR